MESGFNSKDVKDTDNTPLNLALAICFSGMFLMIMGGVFAAALAVFGTKAFNTDLTYLFAVSFYLGLVIVALVGATFSFSGKEIEQRVPVRIRRHYES